MYPSYSLIPINGKYLVRLYVDGWPDTIKYSFNYTVNINTEKKKVADMAQLGEVGEVGEVGHF